MHPTIALAAQAVQDPPIIDLDHTVFLQLALFLVTFLVLSRLLFRPYLAMRAARERGIEGARDAARRMEEEADAKMADHESRLTKAKMKAQDERLGIRAEGSRHEREVLEAAREKTQATLVQARRQLEGEAKGARAELGSRTQELAQAIFARILARGPVER